MPDEGIKKAMSDAAYGSMPFKNKQAAKANAGRPMPSNEQRIGKLETRREQLLNSPSGAQGKGKRDSRMEGIKAIDKSIINLGGKVKPLNK